MKYTDEELRRLLARGRLGRSAKERMLDRVLERSAPARPARRRPWLLALTLAVGSGVAVLVLVMRPHDELRAKGSPGGQAVALEARCPGQAAGHCRQESALVFSVFGADQPGHFQAYAVSTRGDKIWYFSAETRAPWVAASTEVTRPVGRSVVIGPEHAPGPYQLHLFLTREPLPMDVLLHDSDPRILARATLPLIIEPAATGPREQERAEANPAR